MARSRDPLALTPNWHVDLRIEAELPEDNVIGRRFLINVAFTAVTLIALLATGWLGFVTLSLRHQIRDWEQRINDNRAEVGDIQRMQREYAVEAAKIDQAYALVCPQFFVSDLVADIGRSRPDPMTIDILEWNDGGVVMRGNLRERSERATQILGGYVETLRRDPKIGPLFREIVLTDVDRGSSGETLRFEIVFRPKQTSI